jgi:hypothetical protein
MELQLAYKAVGVLEKQVLLPRRIWNLGNYFKQGILQKTDLLSVQVRVNEIKTNCNMQK